MHALPNNLGYPRLGIVVSKKTARRSVDRNYMRRVVREWFRYHRNKITSLDLVVRINKPFGRADFAQMQVELQHLLDKMCKRSQADQKPQP